MIAEIGTIIIFTAHIDKLAKYYEKCLSLGAPTSNTENHIGYSLGSIYFGFDQKDVMKEASGSVTLWFRVDDIDATFQSFVKYGGTEVYQPHKKPWGATIAAVKDLDGNLVGLEQR